MRVSGFGPALLCVLFVTWGWCQAAAAQPAKPNIVFIMVDDAGIGDFSPYGATPVQTPNIQAMADKGLMFTSAYAGSTVCAPSRSALLTGKHLGHAFVRGNQGGVSIRDQDVTIAEVLKSAGYATGGFGKWGLGAPGTPGTPERQGFDVFLGPYHQVHAHKHYTNRLYLSGERFPVPENDGFSEPNVGLVDPARKHTHYVYVEAMKQFITDSVAAGKPFFAYGPWNPPHVKSTLPADEAAYDLYRNEPWHDEAKIQAAMLTMMDRQVGEIIELLETLGVADNTLVIFCSDNGGAKAAVHGAWKRNRDLLGQKVDVTEGGLRTPMVAYWPGTIQAGAVTDLHTYFPDMMATFADLAGVTGEVPEDTDGISIAPTLTGVGVQETHKYLYFADEKVGNWGSGTISDNLRQAMRYGKWKAIRHSNPYVFRLYDLSVDPNETTNVASSNPQIATEIAGLMDEAHDDAPPQLNIRYNSALTGEYTFGVRGSPIAGFDILNGSFEKPVLDPNGVNSGMLQKGGIADWTGGVVYNPANVLAAGGGEMFADPLPNGSQVAALWPAAGAQSSMFQTLHDGGGTAQIMYLEDLHRSYEVELWVGRRMNGGTSSEPAILSVEVGGVSGHGYLTGTFDTSNLEEGEWTRIRVPLELVAPAPVNTMLETDLGLDLQLRLKHEEGDGTVFVDHVRFGLRVSCPADLNGDGVLDIFDFLAFQNAFVSGLALVCDCDVSTGSVVCDIFDFLCFQEAFVAGCA